MSVRPLRFTWPLVFSLQPSGLDLLEHADYVYDLQHQFSADGGDVLAQFFDDSLVGGVTGLRGFAWQSTPGDFAAAVVQEHFVYMSLQMRTIAWTPGLRLATSIDRCSLPLGRQMLQVMDATPERGGGCRFRWRIAVRYLPGMAVFAPVVTPVFRRMFEQTIAAVDRKLSGAEAHPARGGRASSGSRTRRADRRARGSRSIDRNTDSAS
jgi:hypothetical protein